MKTQHSADDVWTKKPSNDLLIFMSRSRLELERQLCSFVLAMNWSWKPVLLRR